MAGGMRWRVVAAWALCLAPAAFWAGGARGAETTAEQVIERNVAARGGAAAWRKIETMVWIGHLESERAPAPSLPFVMQQKRPNRTHFEISVMGKRTVRVFDGAHGWRVHPTATGPDVKPFTPQEVTFAFRSPGIESPLIDYEAKGNRVTLQGLDDVEGHKAYRLAVVRASGETDTLWIDAATYLDVRYDRPSYGPAGAPPTVSVFYSNYKNIDGLQIPALVETAAGPGQTRDRMVIERFLLNTPVEDRLFAEPGAPGRHGRFAMSSPPRAPGPGAAVPLRSGLSGAAPDPGSAAR